MYIFMYMYMYISIYLSIYIYVYVYTLYIGASTAGLVASVPTYYFSKTIIDRAGHFKMVLAAQMLTVGMLLLHALVTVPFAMLVLPIQALKGAVLALLWSRECVMKRWVLRLALVAQYKSSERFCST